MRQVLRREDERLVTGQGRYLDNLPRDGVLHCAFARSTIPHGRLAGVSLDEVRAAADVVAAYTGADLGLRDIPGRMGRGPEAPDMPRPPLAVDTVRHVGEAIAVVVATDRYAAADAVDLTDVDIEPYDVVTDTDDALTDGTLLFPAAGTNVVSRATLVDSSDGERRTLDEWPVRATVEVDNQRLAPVSLEPAGIRAAPTDDGGLAIWCGHQAPHRLRNELATLLDLDAEGIRVIVPDVGGAFGMKAQLYPEYLIVAAIALRLQRPVQWIQSRYEQFVGGTHGRAQRARMTLAGDRDGRIGAALVDITAELGAYPHAGSPVPWNSGYLATGPYAFRDLKVTATMVVTNRAPVAAYRGAGRPEAAFVLERAVDAFAAAAGLDPVAVRRRNLVPTEALPYHSPTGALYDSGDYRRVLDLALDVVDADGVRREQRRRLEAGLDPIGLGIGSFMERAGGPLGSWEYARVELGADGGLVARVGTSAAGQGHDTVWSQVVAAVFDSDPTTIEVITGDTAEVADGGGSAGSRSAQLAGSALQRLSIQVEQRAREIAAELLEIDARDLSARDGGFAPAGDPASRVSFADVHAHALTLGVELGAEERFNPDAHTFPYGTYIAVAGVELETGRVTLQRIVAVDDCGVVLNPQIVEGQVHGALAQGIAQALYEGIEYSPEGQPLTTSLIDYFVPAAPDLPGYVTDRIVTPAPSNPLGVKGSGEAGCIGAPPAIVNAVLDALRPYGVTDLQMPLTPERVWRALQAERVG